MRKLLPLFLILFLAVCLYSQLSVNKKNQNITYYSEAERDSIMNVLQGDWLVKNYYDELIRTKSPMKALGKSSSWAYLKISKDAEDPNVFSLSMQEEFHSSGFATFVMVKRDSLKFESHSEMNGNYRLKISRLENNTIYFYDDYNQEEAKYIKCPPLDTFMNTLLLAGTYTQEGGSPENIIIFNPDGSIKGLGKLMSYEIGLDAFLGDNDAFFTYYGKDIAWYAYEISGNTLNIYDGIWTSETSIEKGKLLYKLTKIK